MLTRAMVGAYFKLSRLDGIGRSSFRDDRRTSPFLETVSPIHGLAHAPEIEIYSD